VAKVHLKLDYSPTPCKRFGGRRTVSRVPAKEPKRDFKVGDKIRANLHHGKIEDAVVRAVIEHTDGTKLQVDFGYEQTALIGLKQVVSD
jgi:hypothetical protein